MMKKIFKFICLIILLFMITVTCLYYYSPLKSEMTVSTTYSFYPNFGDVFAKLSIPSLNINADVVEGDLEYLISDKVGHYVGSYLFNENGLILLSGHNTDSLLGNMHLINKNDIINISTDLDNYTYIVYDTFLIDAKELEKNLNFKTDCETLVIYTCSNEPNMRFVLYAKRVNI